MNQRQRIDYLNEKYLNKKVKIISDIGGVGEEFLNCVGLVTSINERQYQTTLLLKILNANEEIVYNNWNCYICDVQLIEEPKIVHQEKKGIVLVKRTIETVDEFGNDYILQLLPPDQKYIYLSTALRTLLNVNDGDYISFALDNENKLYYICKEIDHNNGYLVQNGKIESNVEWRNIFNTFNLETTKIEEGKLKFHISHYVREQEELPDYSLFLINHQWVEETKKKKKEIEFVPNPELSNWAQSTATYYEKVAKDPFENIRNIAYDSYGIKKHSINPTKEEKPSTKKQVPKKGISEKGLLAQLQEEDKSEF